MHYSGKTWETIHKTDQRSAITHVTPKEGERERERERERIRNTEYGIRNFISFRPWPMKNTLSYANLHHHVLSMNYQIYDIQLN